MAVSTPNRRGLIHCGSNMWVRGSLTVQQMICHRVRSVSVRLVPWHHSVYSDQVSGDARSLMSHRSGGGRSPSRPDSAGCPGLRTPEFLDCDCGFARGGPVERMGHRLCVWCPHPRGVVHPSSAHVSRETFRAGSRPCAGFGSGVTTGTVQSLDVRMIGASTGKLSMRVTCRLALGVAPPLGALCKKLAFGVSRETPNGTGRVHTAIHRPARHCRVRST